MIRLIVFDVLSWKWALFVQFCSYSCDMNESGTVWVLWGKGSTQQQQMVLSLCGGGGGQTKNRTAESETCYTPTSATKTSTFILLTEQVVLVLKVLSYFRRVVTLVPQQLSNRILQVNHIFYHICSLWNTLKCVCPHTHSWAQFQPGHKQKVVF